MHDVARRNHFYLAMQHHRLRLLAVFGLNAVDVRVGDGQVVRVAQVGARRA